MIVKGRDDGYAPMARKVFEHAPVPLQRQLIEETLNNVSATDLTAYCIGSFSHPESMSQEARKQYLEALMTFAGIGWTLYHALPSEQSSDGPVAKKAARTRQRSAQRGPKKKVSRRAASAAGAVRTSRRGKTS